mgnify:CR=1 FL=1
MALLWHVSRRVYFAVFVVVLKFMKILYSKFYVNDLLTITLTPTFASGSCGMWNQFYNLKFVYDWTIQS